MQATARENVNRRLRLTGLFALRRDLVLLLGAIILITTGEELWTRFLPKYLQTLGVDAVDIGLLTGIEMITAMACTIPAAYFADKYKREPFIIRTFLFSHSFPSRYSSRKRLPFSSLPSRCGASKKLENRAKSTHNWFLPA